MKRFPVSHSKRRIRLRVSGSQRNDDDKKQSQGGIKKLSDKGKDRVPRCNK